MVNERERWLTFQERAVWGKCPACGAEDGEACNSDVGLVPYFVGHSSDAPRVHLGRISSAPRRVREVAID